MLQPMTPTEAINLLLPIVDVFQRLGIPYHVGGSVASSYYGDPRPTRDVDVVADLSISQVPPFIAQFDPSTYFVQVQAVTEAILFHTSFNIIELASMHKVDVFIQKPTQQAQDEQQRAMQLILAPGTTPVWVATAEDTIVQKILWWRQDGGQSTQQWGDVVGIIQARGQQLDLTYLQQVGASLSILVWVQQAFQDAGIPFP